MAVSEEVVVVTARELLSRARGEFMEMPGLSLTLDQAQRLWALDRQTCSGVLSNLVRDGFLRQRRDGSYIRHGGGVEARSTARRIGG